MSSREGGGGDLFLRTQGGVDFCVWKGGFNFHSRHQIFRPHLRQY